MMALASIGRKSHTIVITTKLLKLSDTDMKAIGHSLIPSASGKVIRSFGRNYTKKLIDIGSLKLSLTATLTSILRISAAESKGKILLLNEIYAPNGKKSTISEVATESIFYKQRYVGTSIRDMQMKTKLEITPTILRYCKEKPEDSQIKIDINLEVSAVTGSKMLQNVSCPEFTIKKLITTRVFTADG